MDGEPGPDAGVLAALHRSGRHLADLTAAALLDLARFAPLALVVGDGPHGVLEGWFYSQGVDHALLRKFVGESMRRGAVDSIPDYLPPHLRPFAGEGCVLSFQQGLRMLSTVKYYDAEAPVLMPGGRRSDGAFQRICYFNPEVVKA